MNTLNRKGSRKNKLRNLLKRGRIWYWKKMVDGVVEPVSLKTDNEALAIAKRDLLEAQRVSGELAKLREVKQAATLAEVFAVYEKVAAITDKAMRGNKNALLGMINLTTGQPADAGTVTLAQLSDKLVRDYQDAMRANYVKELQAECLAANRKPTEKELREARDRADRTSKSLARQARSIFAKEQQFIERYRENGLIVPECVVKFRDASAVGSMTTKLYFPPSDVLIAATFKAIETQREQDPELYNLFWAALATGCRKNELTDLQPAHFVELNGLLWINGGMGKDGQTIQIPVINWPVHPSNPTVPADVVKAALDRKLPFLLKGTDNERRDELPRRLNAWLEAQGWTDDKKLHALRAYIGSMLFQQNPRLAQRYLRHKSLSTTETFYTHFIELSKVTQLRMVEAPKLEVVQPAAVA